MEATCSICDGPLERSASWSVTIEDTGEHLGNACAVGLGTPEGCLPQLMSRTKNRGVRLVDAAFPTLQ